MHRHSQHIGGLVTASGPQICTAGISRRARGCDDLARFCGYVISLIGYYSGDDATVCSGYR